MFQNTRKRASRRGWPIIGFTGPNGSGKSAAMVWDTAPSLAAGRRVLSTVRLLDWENPRPCDDPACTHPEHAGQIMAVPGGGAADESAGVHELGLAVPSPAPVTHKAAHPLYVPFTDWEQLLEAEHCDVLMDEVTGVASSRESQSMPAPVANKLVQLRRADVVVRWSAPSWSRADKIIRECSQAVVYAQGYLPKAHEDGDRMWRNRRMFKWATYDAAEFEDFTLGKREQLPPMSVDWHWGPGSPVFSMYDSFDAVSTIGTVTDSGRCYRCGGRRRVPTCSCPDHSPDETSGVDEGGPRGAGAVVQPLPRPPKQRTASQ
jgi:hypothetical protein